MQEEKNQPLRLWMVARDFEIESTVRKGSKAIKARKEQIWHCWKIFKIALPVANVKK